MLTPIPLIVAASVRRPRITILLSLLLAVLAISVSARNFSMTTDTAALISPDVDWRKQERAMETAFPQLRDTLLIVIDGASPELAEDAAARLTTGLEADKSHFRRVARPDGGPFFAREGLLYGSRDDVRKTTASLIEAQPMLGPLAADPSLRGVATSLFVMLEGVNRGEVTLDRLDGPIRSLADAFDASLAGKPAFFSWQNLLRAGGEASQGSTRKLVLVQPVLDHSALMPGEAATAAITAMARELDLDSAHGVQVRMTGEVPLADEEFATLSENIGVVAIVMFLAMIATLWFAVRSARLVVAIMITILTGLAVTTAVGLLAIGRFNLISVAFIPLFVGLGVDFGIQICVRFNAERIADIDTGEALRRAASALGAPLLLAAGAIFLGFIAFLPTAYIGIAELGVIAGCGMVIALVFSVSLLPAIVMLLPPKASVGEVGFVTLAGVDRFLEKRRAQVLWAFGLSMAASIALLPLVRFDFNPLHLRDPNSPAMQTLTDLMHDPDRTPNTIDVLADNAQAARLLARRLAVLPEVGQVVTIDSFVPDDQPAKLALISDASLLLDLTLNPFDLPAPPSDPELVTSLRSLAGELRAAGLGGGAGSEDALRLATSFQRLSDAMVADRARANAMIARPLMTILDQSRSALQAGPVSNDTLPEDLRRDWVTPDGKLRIQIFPKGAKQDNASIARFRAAVATVTPAISGLPVATQAAASTVAHAFIQAGIIALVLISLLLFAVLRNLKEVAFTLAPVVLSCFLTLGSCVLIGQPINFANIIAFPLLLGVGVAFHIYFVMAWRDGATDLLQSSLARAVMFSALATGTAFGSLWLSHHPGTASMGKILMLSLAWTLVCALIFEPALLGPQQKKQ